MDYMMLNLRSIVWVVLIWAAIQWLVSEKLLRSRRRLPPGPTPFPIIGNLHNLTTQPHRALAELAKIHGPLMFLRFGFLNTVVVSSPDVAREVLQKKDVNFSERAVPDCLHAQQFSDYSMTMMPPNHRWRTVRKIVNSLLFTARSLNSSQDLRMEKMKDLVSYVSGCSQARVAVNIGQLSSDTSLNLLSNTFFSMDLADPNSDLCREFKELTWFLVRDAGKPNLADFFPVFKRVDPQRLRKKMGGHIEKFFNFFDKIVEKRLATRKDSTNELGDDLLDALLKICRDKSEDFEFHQIRRLIMDVFVGGSETTSSTIEWAMAELLHEPTKLKAAQEELHRVVGKGNFVKEADLAHLPYLQAVVKETLRLHPIVPLLLPRKANSDMMVHDFRVPKDSQVLVNVWAIGRDPSLWESADKFKPERFINSDIDFRGNHFKFIPFGSGRRICIGMQYAIRMLPLILGNLISFFDWKLEDGIQPEIMDMDEKFGMALQKATSLYAIPISITS